MSDEHSFGLDGIKEGNNRVPTWLAICWIVMWCWGFYYLYTFWTMPGDKEKNQVADAAITYKNPHQEGFIASSAAPGTPSEAPQQAAAGGADEKLLADGKAVYEANCAGCHGMEGDGNGPAAAALTPKPRNFVQAKFKYGSDDASLMKTIANGVKGTAMPAWKDTLSADQIKAVMTYERSFHK